MVQSDSRSRAIPWLPYKKIYEKGLETADSRLNFPESRLALTDALTVAPFTEKIFVKKNGKCNQDFLQVLPKSSGTTFKAIFETLSALGFCHLTIIRGWYTRNP